MSDGSILFAITVLICSSVFLNGVRFARMTANPWTKKRVFGMPIEGAELPIERVRLIGRIQMIVAPVFLLFFAALCFGLLGPVEGIRTIQFQKLISE